MSDKIFEPQYPAQDYTKRPNSRALLSPIYDWTFKAMFSQETEESNIALKSFISAAIGREIMIIQHVQKFWQQGYFPAMQRKGINGQVQKCTRYQF